MGPSNEALLFHEKCGALIKLSNGHKTAERRRPLDEFNNGVVLTNRPLRDGEMFEVGSEGASRGSRREFEAIGNNEGGGGGILGEPVGIWGDLNGDWGVLEGI